MRKLAIPVGIIFTVIFFQAAVCFSVQEHMPTTTFRKKGSDLSKEVKKMVSTLKSQYEKFYKFKETNLQISPYNFYEKETRMNLPFSNTLSEELTAAFKDKGVASVSHELIGDKPVRATGTYFVTGDKIMVTVRLRLVNNEGSDKDLAVAKIEMDTDDLPSGSLQPEFQRISRSLINLLEMDYQGSDALSVFIPDFKPANKAQPELILGKEMAKYLKDAVVTATVFTSAGHDKESADALIIGDYLQTGGQMTFHVKVVDNKTGKRYAGTKISAKLEDIPKELKLSSIQSIDHLITALSNQLVEAGKARLGARGNTIYIPETAFHDNAKKAITPLARSISRKFKNEFLKKPMFDVIEDSSGGADFVLTGSYQRESGRVVVSAGLKKIRGTQSGCGRVSIAAAEGKLDRQFVDTSLMKTDFKSYTDYLMVRLEDKAMGRIPCKQRNKLVIYRLSYENQKEHTDYSDYLHGYFLDYFTGSAHFSPVEDTSQRLTGAFSEKKRAIVVQEADSEATITGLSGAKYYISGSFWPKPGGKVEVKAVMKDTNGGQIATENIEFKDTGKEVDKPEIRKDAPVQPVAVDGKLSVNIWTQKGPNNLVFYEKEEIIFFVKVNDKVYLQIFYAGDDGNVIRIFPNKFDTNNFFQPGEAAAIPSGEYHSKFKFGVEKPVGKETVFAIVSERKLPGPKKFQDVGNQMRYYPGINMKQLQDHFIKEAALSGVKVAWDTLPILTKEKQ